MAMFDNYLLCQTHEDDVVFRTNDLIGAMLGRVQRFVGTTNVVLVGALTVPPQSLHQVLPHPLAMLVHDAKIVIG